MNKSKFLKRSLAALLAILMVATMIPSAFAAVTTVEDAPMAFAADDPGYNISVDGNRATWDAAENAYTVSTSFEEGNSLPDAFKASMIEVKNHKVTVLSGINAQLKATVENLGLDKAEKNVDSFGVGTYAYDVESVVTNDEGDVQSTAKFKLLVNLTMEPKSSDASLRAIKSARLPYAIKAEFDNEKNTIDVVMALNKKSTHDASLTDLATGVTAKDIFIPTNDAATVGYSSKKVTVTAKNGDTKEYAVTFTEESAFETFKLGDFEGKATEDNVKVINVDLPYSYNNNGTINYTEVDKLVASWTTALGNKVSLTTSPDNTVIKSGEKKLTFTGGTTGNEDVNGDGENDYLTVTPATGSKVKVQTKKSGEAVEVTIKVRVPVKNPDAELTGIQIVDDAYVTSPVDQEANYTQYVAIDKGSRNITVNLPTNMKKDANEDYALSINVWGAKNSYIELAEGRVSDENAFADDSDNNDGKGLQLDDGKAESANPINVSKPVTLKVVSEDEATTLLYTLTVKESTSSAATLSSLKVVNDKGEEVGTVKASGKDYTVTLPYKYGLDANADALKALKVVATASSSAKIGYAATDELAEAGTIHHEAVPAIYEIETKDKTPVSTDGNNLSIGGIDVAIADTTTNGTIEAQLAIWAANAAVTGNSTWNIEVNGTKVTFTAKVAGKIGGSVAGVPSTAPDGAGDAKTEGKDAYDEAVTATEFTPFVKDVLIGDDTDPSLFGAATITLPLASKKVTTDADVSNDNPQENNIFFLRVNNGADNGTNYYKVTIKKADPNKEAKITSAKVTDSATRATMTEYNTTISTRDAKDTSVIKVSELPHALEEDDKSMYFSELEVSDEAHVVIKPATTPGPYNQMSVDKDSNNNSKPFSVGAGENRWDKKNKFVEVWVFSEADWYKASADGGIEGNITAATKDKCTKVYKMSATYAAAERGSDLTSIASTLDETVKVNKASKTVTITVPYTYLEDNIPDDAVEGYGEFSLDIVTSKLATVYGNAVTGVTSVEITPDKGDADTVGRTMFTIKKDSGDNDKVKLYKDTTAVEKLVVQSESGDNTTDYNVVVKVAKVETSYEIQSITAAGKSAVKSEDGETWTLTIPADLEKLQLVDIVTVSKLAAVEVDGAPYDPETYYDLGDDLKIQVTAENEDAFTYTLKIEEDTNQSSDATLSEVKVGEYEVTKSGNDYTVKVPEGTDVTKLPLTLTATDSKIKGITVNGTAYTEGMEVDLTTAATIVVTAEDGSTATYTLTAVTGDVQKPSDKYTDIPAGAMGDYIKAAIDNGIMVGTSETKFSPNVDIPRWQFALLIARADLRIKNADITSAAEADAELKKLYSGTPAFSDPKNNELYDAAIEYCSKNKIISGIGNNKFDPNGKVNRLQAARMISDWTGVTDATKTENTHDIKDWNKINWGKHYVNSVYDAGFMQGRTNGNFGPQDVLKRSEAAVVIMKAYEYMADK
ncbi:S-layer homology domain-containing protein [Acutalibacter muris]|uniref:S-layer homology domain-containing protein n=1 Tax=Acutalibacter muris TaxID=1796620 RepID=UPI001C3E8AF8|nr:S-layer homology domain-containing protein [Acutalibacter muris]